MSILIQNNGILSAMKVWLILFTLIPGILFAESRRIHVYPVTQAYYDVKPGDTLGEITQKIMPNIASMHNQLMSDIVQLNPNAFINGDPNQLKSHVRLWLPNNTAGLDDRVNTNKFTIKDYSWGYTRTPK